MSTAVAFGLNHFPMINDYPFKSARPINAIYIFEIKMASSNDPQSGSMDFFMPFFSNFYKIEKDASSAASELSINDFISSDIFKSGTFPSGSDQISVNSGTPSRKRSKLGIHNKNETCIIVIKLGDEINCRFSTSFSPFTIGEDITNSKYVQTFWEARFLNNSLSHPTKPIPDIAGHDTLHYPPTKWAYFVFDGGAVTDIKYAHRFNINVEFFDEQTGDVMPITIDPDVGHPGGGPAQ